MMCGSWPQTAAGSLLRDSARALRVELRRHRRRQRGGIGDQQGLRAHIVLGLRQQVGRDEIGGIGSAVGNDQHFRRTGRQIAGRAFWIGRNDLLCRRGQRRAGTEDLVDLGNAGRAIGHGRNGLRAAGLEHLRRRRSVAPPPALLRWRVPSAAGGVHSTRSGQPASVAGTATMITVEGSGAEPAGTYSPTAGIGRNIRSQLTPGITSMLMGAPSCAA